jgi:septal ring factor EnvC (AmiA/AmiB activator)
MKELEKERKKLASQIKEIDKKLKKTRKEKEKKLKKIIDCEANKQKILSAKK